MKWFARIGLLVFLPAMAFIVGFNKPELQDGKSPSLGALKRLSSPQKHEETPVQLFKSSFDFIRTNYAKKVDPAELKHAGMAGLMASIGDPHTMFFEPVAAEQFKEETSGTKNYAGVGARLQRHDLGVKITSAFADGPAFRAGVRDRDVITGVNGKSVAGMEVDDIIKQIKGPEGTTVKLTLTQASTGKSVTLTVRRAKILQPSVDGTILENTKVGYISVFSFSQVTAVQFEEQLNRLGAESLDGLVIDMRGNPGGLLESARDMLSLFATNKVVVTMKERNGEDRETKTFHNLKRDITCPIVVLVNEDSASAAEIFAGAMRDYGLATLVGEHTYGKASVQNLHPLGDGATAKITIAKYFLPSGKDISRKQTEEGEYISGGLKPDYEVKLSLDPKTQIGDPALDNQLKRALEVIKGKQL
jgi:carboxyl-terminal processing protease